MFGNNFDLNGDLIVGAIKSSVPKKQKPKSTKSCQDIISPKSFDNKLSSTAYDELFGNIDDIPVMMDTLEFDQFDDNETENIKCHHPSRQSIDMNPYLDEEYIFNVETDENVIDVVHGFTKSPSGVDQHSKRNRLRVAEDELFDSVHTKKKKKRKKRKKRKSKKHRPSQRSIDMNPYIDQQYLVQSPTKNIAKEYSLKRKPNHFKSNKLSISDYQITPILDTSDNSEIESITNVLGKYEQSMRRTGLPEHDMDEYFSDY